MILMPTDGFGLTDRDRYWTIPSGCSTWADGNLFPSGNSELLEKNSRKWNGGSDYFPAPIAAH